MSGTLVTALGGGPIDVALLFDPDTVTADFGTANNDLETDAGLHTAVVLSLFSDRVANSDDVLPYPVAPGQIPNRRGWWADAPADGSAPTSATLSGSRLWLLARAVAIPETALLARQYISEALAWMTATPPTGGLPIATQVGVQTAWQAADRLGITVSISRTTPGGSVNHSYDLYWQRS